jgi:hypothetical protein
MEPGMSFHENVHMEFKKGLGEVFNKHIKVRELAVKME